MAPTTTDVLETPRDHRTPEEVSTYLKNWYRGPCSSEAKSQGTTAGYHLLDLLYPMEDSAPRYAGWEAYGFLFVAIDILTHNDGIRHSGFEGHAVETVIGFLILAACALQFLHMSED